MKCKNILVNFSWLIFLSLPMVAMDFTDDAAVFEEIINSLENKGELPQSKETNPPKEVQANELEIKEMIVDVLGPDVVLPSDD